MTRSDEALNYLLDAVSNGEEFPDAAPQAARMFRVNYEKLKDAYDDYFIRKEQR